MKWYLLPLLLSLLGTGKVNAVTFATPDVYSFLERPGQIISGDLDSTNGPDLVVANQNYISVLLDQGGATYSVREDYVWRVSGGYVSALGLVDLDSADGLDIVFIGNSLSVMINNGDGTFQAPVDYTIRTTGVKSGLEFRDFDGLNGVDILVSYGAGVSTLYLNDGSGSFSEDTEAIFPLGMYSLHYTDLDGFNGMDRVFLNVPRFEPGGEIRFDLKNLDDSYSMQIISSPYPLRVLSENLTGLNGPELVLLSSSGNLKADRKLLIYANEGSGIIGDSEEYVLPDYSLYPQIFDADGMSGPDVVVPQYNSAPLLFTNNGSGGFVSSSLATSCSTYCLEMHIDDLDQNNGLDVIIRTAEKELSVFLNTTTIVPQALSFLSQLDVALDMELTSREETLSGLGGSEIISVTGGEYSINGGAFTSSSGTVTDWDRIRVKHTTASQFNTRTDTVVTIGTTDTTFYSITELDNLPDPFSFGSSEGVKPGALVESEGIVVQGIAAPTSIAVENGRYSINGGAFTENPGEVSGGDSVVVRGNASLEYFTEALVTLSIGGVEGQFSIVSKQDDDPKPFSFEKVRADSLNELVVSETKKIKEIAVPIAISVVGGEYRINDGSFTSEPSLVESGDSVTLRGFSSAEFGGTTMVTLAFGSKKAFFEIVSPKVYLLYNDVSIELKDSEFGALGSWGLMSLFLTFLLRFRRVFRSLVCLGGGLVISFGLNAQEPVLEIQAAFVSHDYLFRTGGFNGLSAFDATTSIESRALNSDKGRGQVGARVGIRLDSLNFQLGHIELDEFSLSQTTTGSGLTEQIDLQGDLEITDISIGYRKQFSSNWYVEPQIGIYRWDSRVFAQVYGNDILEMMDTDDASGTDPLAGLTVSYQFHKNFHTGISYRRYLGVKKEAFGANSDSIETITYSVSYLSDKVLASNMKDSNSYLGVKLGYLPISLEGISTEPAYGLKYLGNLDNLGYSVEYLRSDDAELKIGSQRFSIDGEYFNIVGSGKFGDSGLYVKLNLGIGHVRLDTPGLETVSDTGLIYGGAIGTTLGRMLIELEVMKLDEDANFIGLNFLF